VRIFREIETNRGILRIAFQLFGLPMPEVVNEDGQITFVWRKDGEPPPPPPETK
jgi:hypothetical protein